MFRGSWKLCHIQCHIFHCQKKKISNSLTGVGHNLPFQFFSLKSDRVTTPKVSRFKNKVRRSSYILVEGYGLTLGKKGHITDARQGTMFPFFGNILPVTLFWAFGLHSTSFQVCIIH